MRMNARVLVPLVALATLAAADPTASPPAGTALSTKVKRVVVYSDRARVTRIGSVSLQEARQRVYVPDLPASIDDASVSAAIPGSHAARILSIEVETTYGKQTSRKDAEALIEKGKDLDRKLRAMDDDLAALSTEEQYLRSFQVKTKLDDKGRPVPVTLDANAWQQTLAFVSNGLSDVLARERAKQLDRQELQKQRNALETDLQKARAYESVATKRVALEIEGGSGASDLEVTYTIGGPSWRPAYDVRVLSSTGKVELVTHAVVRQNTGEDWKDVDMTLSTASPDHGAELPQLLAWRLGDAQEYAYAAQNGDVGQMGAGLAEAKPALDSVVAEETVTVSRSSRRPGRPSKAAKMAEAPPPPAAEPMEAPLAKDEDQDALRDAITEDAEGDAGGEGGIAIGSVGGAAYGAAANAPTIAIGAAQYRSTPARPVEIRAIGENVWSLPAGHAFTFVNQPTTSFSWTGDVLRCPSPVVAANGFDYAFKPKRKVTVLSDNRERKVKLTTDELPAELLYEVVAPVSTKAYLRATVTNARKQPFLAGESFVFLDDDFVGRAFINTVAPAQKLDLSLGIDEDLKVDRRVEQKAADSGLFTKKEKTSYDVTISLKSFKKRTVTVVVRDRVPITWQKDDISIGDVEAKPNPWDEKDQTSPAQGLYAWKLEVPAGGKRDVKLKYSVEHPRDFDLVESRGNR